MTGCTPPLETHWSLGEGFDRFDDGWLVLHNAISGVFNKISVFGIKEAIPLPSCPEMHQLVCRSGEQLVDQFKNTWYFHSRKLLKRNFYGKGQMPQQLPRLPKWGGSGRMACIWSTTISQFYLQKGRCEKWEVHVVTFVQSGRRQAWSDHHRQFFILRKAATSHRATRVYNIIRRETAWGPGIFQRPM